MVRRVALVCLMVVFCFSALIGCAPVPGSDAPPATTAPE